jgi:hypothetical protein
MLSVTNKALMLSVIMLNVMLTVVAPLLLVVKMFYKIVPRKIYRIG